MCWIYCEYFHGIYQALEHLVDTMQNAREFLTIVFREVFVHGLKNDSQFRP